MKPKATVLAKSEFYQISYYKAHHILCITWFRTPSPEEYRKATKVFLEVLRDKGLKKVISDCSKRGNISPQDQLWLTHQVVPALCQEEVTQLALVVPNDPNHARDLEGCLISSEVCYELQFFHSTSDALDWLFSNPQQKMSRAVA